MEEVGHAPHSSLRRLVVWIGSLYNTSGGGEVAHISLLITEERQAERGGERQKSLGLDCSGQYRRY